MKFSPILSKKINCVVVVAIVLAMLLPFANAKALTVSPARLEIDGNPGTELRADMILMNDKDENQVFYSSYANFEAQGESGTPNFVDGTTDLASWMNVPETLTLAPFETKTIPLIIKIPNGTDPGGHFAAVFWSTQPPHSSNGGQLAIGAKLGILVLLRVNGDIKEGGSIINFSTKNDQKSFRSLPVTFNYRFNNDGADRVKPVGTITIRNILGIKSKVIDANPSQGNILPKSIRKFETSWSKATSPSTEVVPMTFFENVSNQWKNFAFGRYTATLALTYTSKNISNSATTSFYVWPWQLLIVILVILAIIYFGLRKVLRSYNKMLVAQIRTEIQEEIEEKKEEEQQEQEQVKDHKRGHSPHRKV